MMARFCRLELHFLGTSFMSAPRKDIAGCITEMMSAPVGSQMRRISEKARSGRRCGRAPGNKTHGQVVFAVVQIGATEIAFVRRDNLHRLDSWSRWDVKLWPIVSSMARVKRGAKENQAKAHIGQGLGCRRSREQIRNEK